MLQENDRGDYIKLYDIEELDVEADEDDQKPLYSLDRLELTGTIGNFESAISCIECNKTGDFMTTGDGGGKLKIYRRDPVSNQYNKYTNIQSHGIEFDCCKSEEINNRINQLQWLEQMNPSQFLLATNDTTIKLWKIAQKELEPNKEDYHFQDMADRWAAHQGFWNSKLKVPKLVKSNKPKTLVKPSRIFENGHHYSIHSISINSDQETFLSSCETHINLWNLEVTKELFNLVDFDKVSDIANEFITTSSFHPSSCSLFAYGSSEGKIRLCDMRENAICDKYSKLFEDPPFFSPDWTKYLEYSTRISDLKWSPSGKLFASRDYTHIKIWDPNMDKKPIEVYPIQEYLKPHLKKLCHSNRLNDVFELKWKPDESGIFTSNYNNVFSIIDRISSNDKVKTYQIFQSPIEPPKFNRLPNEVLNDEMITNDLIKLPKDSTKADLKIVTFAWHPLENEILVGTKKNLYVLQEVKTQE